MTRVALLATGVLTLGWLWAGPLPAATASRFSAHMLLHMGVVAVASPLLAVAVAGSRYDPTRRWPGFFNPIAASILELVVVWGWHAPLFHHAARQHTGVLVLEQLSFLAAGLWLWLAVAGGERTRDPHRVWSGMAALLFTSIHMTLLGALFALAPRAIYAHPDGAASVSDQHLGGSLMLLIGGASYLAGGLWLARQGLRAPVATGGGAV